MKIDLSDRTLKTFVVNLAFLEDLDRITTLASRKIMENSRLNNPMIENIQLAMEEEGFYKLVIFYSEDYPAKENPGKENIYQLTKYTETQPHPLSH